MPHLMGFLGMNCLRVDRLRNLIIASSTARCSPGLYTTLKRSCRYSRRGRTLPRRSYPGVPGGTRLEVSGNLPKPVPADPLGYCTTVVGIISAPIVSKRVHRIHSHKEADGVLAGGMKEWGKHGRPCRFELGDLWWPRRIWWWPSRAWCCPSRVKWW